MAHLWIKVYLGFYLVGVMINTVSTQVPTGRNCRWNQLTILRAGGIECLDCPECPEGLGLDPQCGSRVKSDAVVQCVQCKKGISYSDNHDLASCKPCSICDPNEETISPCTVTKNAVCGKCKAGYYRAVTGDCHPCSWCCDGSKDEDLEEQCSKQAGLPPNKICRYDVNTALCGPASSSTPSVLIPKNTAGAKRFPGTKKGSGKANHIWLVATACFLVVVVCVSLIGILCMCNNRKRLSKMCEQCCIENHEVVLQKPTQAISEHDHHFSTVVGYTNSSPKGVCVCLGKR